MRLVITTNPNVRHREASANPRTMCLISLVNTNLKVDKDPLCGHSLAPK